MSRVYFHSPSGEAELWGGERAWLGGMCTDIAVGLLDLQNNRMIPAIVNADYLKYPANPQDFLRWRSSVETAIAVSMRPDAFAWKGKPLDMFSLTLNTAARVGGDPLKLAARIHGQCEIHAWCEGKDRAWLAGIIDLGLEAGVFRRNTGHTEDETWESVARFLRERDDEPVVMSYSVCDGFPNRQTAGWEPPEGADLTPDWAKEAPDEWAECDHKDDYYASAKSDLWYDLGHDERWRAAMDGLRAKPGGLQLSPDGWDDFHFGHGLSALDLIASDYADRLDRALDIR